MKKVITLTVLLAALSWGLESGMNPGYSNSSGAPSKVSGGPKDSYKTCAKSGCHTGKPVVITPGIITSNIPNTGYVGGTTYTITATVVGPGHTKFGFEISPQNATKYLGTLIVTNTQQTKIVSTNYITHKSQGTSGSGTKTWTFNWKAPAAGSGTVTFYGAFNFTNNNGNSTGDSIHTSTLAVNEAEPKFSDLAENSSGNFEIKAYPNPFASSTQLSIATADQSPVSWNIYSLNGQLLEHHEEVPTNTVVQVGENLNEGIYLFTVQSNAGTKTMKLVKSH